MFIIIVLVFSRMYEDEFEPDYGPMDGEIPEPTSKIRGSSQKNKSSPCPVCPARFTNVRRHVLCSHVPWYVSPLTACWTCKLQFAQTRLLDVHLSEIHNQEAQTSPHKFSETEYGSRWVHLMNNLLAEIGNYFGLSTQELVQYVTNNHGFTVCRGSFHHCTDIPLIKLFNVKNQYAVPNIPHKVFPPSFIHSLLHWKVLAILIHTTEIQENLLVCEQELDLFPVKHQKESVNLIDALFHLDMFLKETRCSGLPHFDWENEETKLQYLVTNYCFPHHWPSSTNRNKIREDTRLRLTFGIHPRLVNLESRGTVNKWIKDLEILLDAKGVVAVGECGLDDQYHTSTKDLDKQLNVFENQLLLAKAKQLPVVIHCRGDEVIQNKCLSMLHKILDSQHPVHKHCFNENISSYYKWKELFPNCKFGISPFLLMEHKYPDLRSTVCEMDINDLLIETDAPYLSERGRGTGTPALVLGIAIKLSSMFNLSLEDVARITTSNAMKLYRIQ